MPANNENNLRETLARIDERTLTLLRSHDDLKESLETHVDNIYADIEKHYTKKGEFEPVRKLVFGFVAFMMLSIGGMFIGLLVKGNTSAQDIPPAIQKQFISPVKP